MGDEQRSRSGFHPFLMPATGAFGMLFLMFVWGMLSGTIMDPLGYVFGVVWGVAFVVSLILLVRSSRKQRSEGGA